MPSIFLSLTRSAIFSSRLALFTWYGSSVTMIAIRSPWTSSNATWARMTTRPRPWAYIWRIASTVSVLAGRAGSAAARSGRSCRRSGSPGPGRASQRSSEVISGSSIRATVASQISPRWCGGMFVAIPTAMPLLPLTRRFGRLGREDGRLLLGAVVVVLEVDGLLVDVVEHLGGDRGEARLRVAHRGGAVAVDRAEVALAVDERVAHREVLGEPDEGVVQGDVAVGVVLAHHLADDRGALAVGARRAEPHLAHRVEDPAMDRLQAVADVRQGARHDHAHRVIEVARPASRPRCGWLGCRPGRRSRRRLSYERRSLGDGRAWSCERWLRHRPAEAAAAERSAVSAAARRRRAHPAAGGSRRAGRGSRSASAGSSFGSASRMTHARWPSSVGGRGLRLVVEERRRSLRGRRRAIERSAQASAFWTSGSASPIRSRDERRARGRDLGLAAAPAVDERHRGDRASRRAGAPSATGCRRAARARPSGTARAGSPCRRGGRGCRR